LKASGCATDAASIEKDMSFDVKKLGSSSIFWPLSDGFMPKIVGVAVALKIFVVAVPKTFVAVGAVVPPKIFVVVGAVVPLPKMFVVVGAIDPPKTFAVVVVPKTFAVVVIVVVPLKTFAVVVVATVVPLKIFVSDVIPKPVELPNGKALLLPNVILEKGVELAPNTELED
jgi:hypothetical protein